MITGHKKQRVRRQLTQYAAHILADDLSNRGVVNKRQVLAVMVEIVIGKIEDDVSPKEKKRRWLELENLINH